jgi:hypothetical protein
VCVVGRISQRDITQTHTHIHAPQCTHLQLMAVMLRPWKFSMQLRITGVCVCVCVSECVCIGSRVMK